MAKAWAHAVSGDYWVANNWTPQSQPAATDDIVISKHGTYTVTLNGSVNPGINSLTIQQAAGSSVKFLVTHTRLDVFADASNSGTFAADNAGLVSIRGGLTNRGNVQVGSSSEIQVGGSLVNYGQLVSTAAGAHFYAAGPTRNLGGTITVNFTGASFDFGGTVLNTGQINLDGGIATGAGITQFGGSMLMYAGLKNFGDVDIGTASRLEVRGDFVNEGTVEIGTGSILAADHLINDGLIIADGPSATAGPSMSPQIIVSGDLFNFFEIDLFDSASMTIGGLFTNVGVIGVDGSAPVAGSPTGQVIPSTLDAQGDFRNDGLLEASHNGEILLEQDVINKQFGLILADHSGHIVINGDINNQGGIVSSRSSLVELKGDVKNGIDAGLVADRGKLIVSGEVTGRGDLIIDDTGTMELFGGSAQNQIDFYGVTGGKLILHNSPAVYGDIHGFADTDAIDLMDFLIGSTSMQYTPLSGGTRGNLTLTDQNDPHHVATLRFEGSYVASDFAKSDDGTGHVLVQHQV